MVVLMKVKELIELLNQFDPEVEVITEGCDCYGDVGGAYMLPDDYNDPPTLLIARPVEK